MTAKTVTVMALPLWMLKDLKIHLRHKVALAFIFSLALVCIILDILRTVQALRSQQALYTVLEINLNVIISCLPTYRALLSVQQLRTVRQARKLQPPTSNETSSRRSHPWERKDIEADPLKSESRFHMTAADHQITGDLVGSRDKKNVSVEVYTIPR